MVKTVSLFFVVLVVCSVCYAKPMDKDHDEDFNKCGIPKIKPNLLNEKTKDFEHIVGGSVAVPHSYPWMANILFGPVYHYCGASIIDKEWILTAAHCAQHSKQHYRVVLGDHDMKTKEKHQKMFNVTEIHVHKDYFYQHGSDGYLEYDVALMRLSGEIEYNKHVSPICLPDPEDKLPSEYITTGWGYTYNRKESRDKLRQLVVERIENEKCNATNIYNGKINESMICAGFLKGGKDSCKGDSGGPLVAKRRIDDSDENDDDDDDDESKFFWTLEGITSWGYGCARANKPGVYSNVSLFIDWIESIID